MPLVRRCSVALPLPRGRKQIDVFPNAKTYRDWRYKFQEAVASVSNTPKEAFEWICQTYEAKTHEEFRDGQFPTLDARAATAINKVLNGDFQRKVNLVKKELADKKLMITGRQIAWMMDEYFKTASAEGAVLKLKDLLKVHCRGEHPGI